MTLELQKVGRALRPALWHLMQSDPCDKIDPRAEMGWKWLEPDNDPCDDWPYVEIGGELHLLAGWPKFDFGVDFSAYGQVVIDSYVRDYTGSFDCIVIDEAHFAKPLRDYVAILDDLAELPTKAELAERRSAGYDYQRHNRVRKRRP